MLNAYAFGGYLIFEHVRPFIDARVELYGDRMLSLYDRLQRADSDALDDTLKRYDIAWTIFPPDARIVAALDREPGWRRLHSDGAAVVHVPERRPRCGRSQQAIDRPCGGESRLARSGVGGVNSPGRAGLRRPGSDESTGLRGRFLQSTPLPKPPAIAARRARLGPDNSWRRPGLFKGLGAKTCHKLGLATESLGASSMACGRTPSIRL